MPLRLIHSLQNARIQKRLPLRCSTARRAASNCNTRRGDIAYGAGRLAKSPITEIKKWWWFGGSIHHHVGVLSFWRQQGLTLEGCSEAQPVNDEFGYAKHSGVTK